MKINFNNSNISFSSRNKYIRKADDITRRAKRTFPILSATYADEFYISLSPDNYSERSWLAGNKVLKLHNKIGNMRYTANSKDYITRNDDYKEYTPYKNILEGIKSDKVGNCAESAIIGLTALCANGYTESQRVSLYIHSQYINKKNGETEFEALYPLDHTFVITTMNRKKLINAKDKDIIIVDPWLGFTDSLSGAIARYKQVYSQEQLEEITKKAELDFSKMYIKKNEKLINLGDYELRQHFTIKTSDFVTQYQLQNLGKYAQETYKGLTKTLQSTPANI